MRRNLTRGHNLHLRAPSPEKLPHSQRHDLVRSVKRQHEAILWDMRRLVPGTIRLILLHAFCSRTFFRKMIRLVPGTIRLMTAIVGPALRGGAERG